MGAVWEAEHTALRAAVAVKLIDPQIAGSSEALGRFMREAQAAASLHSPQAFQRASSIPGILVSSASVRTSRMPPVAALKVARRAWNAVACPAEPACRAGKYCLTGCCF
jgi:serine/threonine protein kinase